MFTNPQFDFGGIQPAPKLVWNFLTATAGTLPSWLTYTGATLSMTWDSTGKLTFKPNNLYINSGSATNTARTLTTSAGINYYIWIQTSSGSATVVASGTNTTTFNGSSGGTFTAFTATAGTLTLTPTTNYANITQVVVAAITYESALRSQDNVVTGASAYYGPRTNDYNPSTLIGQGAQIEETRNNYFGNSNTLTNATYWIMAGVTASSSTTSPDGTANASAMLEDGSGAGNVHRSVQTYASIVSGTTYTLSVFVKYAGAVPYFQLTFGSSQFPSNGYVWVNMQTGAKISLGAGATAGDIISIGNGWYRVYLTATATGSGSNNQFFNPSDNSSSATYTGASVNGRANCYIFGAQLESGAFPTSLIYTSAGTVARNADVFTIGSPFSTLLGGSAGSVILQTIAENPSAPAAITNLVRGTNSILYHDTTGKVGTTNGTNILLGGTAATWTSPTRSGLAWSSGGRSLAYTGASSVATDANTVSNGGTLYLGSNNGSAVESGWYQSIAGYNQRNSDAALKAKMTIGSAY